MSTPAGKKNSLHYDKDFFLIPSTSYYLGIFSECVDLQDPHCGWDAKQKACVSIRTVTLRRYIIQDVRQGDKAKCSLTPPTGNTPIR